MVVHKNLHDLTLRVQSESAFTVAPSRTSPDLMVGPLIPVIGVALQKGYLLPLMVLRKSHCGGNSYYNIQFVTPVSIYLSIFVLNFDVIEFEFDCIFINLFTIVEVEKSIENKKLAKERTVLVYT